MMKKWIAIILTIALILGAFWVVSPLTPVYAGEYRSGFQLTPLHFDATGIHTDTGFILKTENTYSLEDIKSMLRLLGDSDLEIKQNKQNEFTITPVKELNSNSLYTFVITTPEKEEVSWTFQTQRDFDVLGSLPAHQSSYVPVNSGIEIYFSHLGVELTHAYFDISPKVEGRFESNGFAVVFIPKKLEPGTLYTVTVKKGLPLDDTQQKLEKDYVFAFETEPEQSGSTVSKGSLSFRNPMMEFSTGKAPVLPIHLYSGNKEITDAVVKTTIYRYKDSKAFIEAIKEKYEQPHWAYSLQEKNLLPADRLTEIASFEQTFDLTQWQDRYLLLPEALEHGFYLVESTYDGLTAQVLIQSTDLSAFFTTSDTKTLVWVNSLKDGNPVENAQVMLSDVKSRYITDASGVAFFDTLPHEPDDLGIYPLQYFLIKGAEEELLLVNAVYTPYRYGNRVQDDYWRYFQTDRNLYKPDDTVQFWGFLQNRNDGGAPDDVTVEIAQGSYWGIPEARFAQYFLPLIQKPLINLTVPADNGFFSGQFDLPDLSPGGYQITIKSGDQVINSHYISVENYVKPAYKMTVEKDKKAIFLGETVHFTVIPAFFDGTPLPSLDISCNINGHPFDSLSKAEKTGMDGKLTLSYTAATNDASAQGERRLYFNANAEFPESGMIYSNDNVRVFVNDIHADFKSNTDKDGVTTLEAAVNRIDLSRINGNEDIHEYPDFLGEPEANKTINGQIVYHYYEKIEDGEEYDYINKVVNKRYRYEERREEIQSFSFTTDKQGFADKTFTLDHPNEGWYTAELTWEDGNGRTMKQSAYLSKHYIRPAAPEYDWYHLETDKEKYRLDETITATLMNNEEPVSSGRILFLEAQKGITKYSVQSDSEYATRFLEAAIPNFYIQGICFTGKGYINAGTKTIAYDTAEVKLNIEVSADKEAYRPGDTVTLNISAKDEDGNPAAAHVNLAIIDEAMLQISSYHVDVLNTLYQYVSSGLGYSFSSHGALSYEDGAIMEETMVRAAGGVNQVAKMAEVDFSGPQPMPELADYVMDMNTVQVRSEFKDTALFRTTALSEDGTGSVSFKLPDNVTSWKISLAGISPDLYGGTGEADLIVTLPFFINDSLNTTYLTGDFPYLGVSSYGNDLKEGEIVTWQVTSPQAPEITRTVTGKAFERTVIPLWQMEAGVYDIEIKAISENGLSDGIRRTIQVVDTYHEIEKAVTQPLRSGMVLTGGEKGLTTLLFTDEGRGKLVPALYGLLYSGGSRLDQKYTATLSKQILDEIAPDTHYSRDAAEVDLTQYQKYDGGFGILPYSESDVKLSALLSSFLKDSASASMLKQYFYTLIYEEPGRVNSPALYGLAVMGEPVLVDLNTAAEVVNLSLEDSLYLALAFEALGEAPRAQKIYVDTIQPVLETTEPYARVVHSEDTDVILKETALTAVLASKLDLEEKDDLFLYVTRHHSRKELINAEKLLYIQEEYRKLPAVEVEFTYSYDGNSYTETLKNGGSVTVTIPSKKLADLDILEVSGEASVVSVFKAPLTEQMKDDENLRITRTYFDYKTGSETTTFKQNDIVKVVLDWDIDAMAIDSHYEITDYAPSGLKPLESPYQAGIRPEKGVWWFKNTDGQKVTFNVYRDSQGEKSLAYYARVVSPGTFKAESPIIQGTLVKDSICLGESATLRITE